jgi:MFS transporter, VNT family, synaptic vesicle glycoprotein 2
LALKLKIMGEPQAAHSDAGALLRAAMEQPGATVSVADCVNATTLRFQRRALWPLAMANACDAAEILSVGYIMTVYRSTETGEVLSTLEKELLSAAVFVGMLIGGVIAGLTADSLGRRPTLLASLSINLTFALLSAAAPSAGWLVAARVLAGLGVGGSIPCVFTYGAELYPVAVRGKSLSLIASFWMIGSIYAATAAWLLLGDGFGGERITPSGTWQHYALVSGLPALLAIALTCCQLPESPRYLAGQGRQHEAAAVLSSMTAVYISADKLCLHDAAATDVVDDDDCCTAVDSAVINGKGYAKLLQPDSDDSSSVQQTASQSSYSESSSSSSFDKCRSSSRSGAFAALLSPPAARTSTVLMLVWFSLSYGSYGVSTWSSQLFTDIGLGNPFLSSLIYSLANLPGNVFSVLFVERIGRKRLLAASMALAAAAAALFAVGTRGGAVLIVSAAAAFNAFSVAGWNCLDALSAESFPTDVRTTGLGLVAASGRAGSIAAQFVNGSLEHNIPLLLLVTSGLMLAGAAATLLLPVEMGGVELQEGGSKQRRSAVHSSRSNGASSAAVHEDTV